MDGKRTFISPVAMPAPILSARAAAISMPTSIRNEESKPSTSINDSFAFKVELIICPLSGTVDDARRWRMPPVLSPGGKGIVSVSLRRTWPKTYEDPGHRSFDRSSLSQSDHVRYYGADVGTFADGFDTTSMAAWPYTVAMSAAAFACCRTKPKTRA